MQWRKAASVILFNTELRHVLMMKRGAGAKFMPNNMVFPGGLLEEADAAFPNHLTNAQHSIGVEGPGEYRDPHYAHKVCALRELFEESGLLLIDGGEVWNSCEDSHLETWRHKVGRDATLFPQLFADTNRLDLKSLLYWANWLTPSSLPKRFDTHLFVVKTRQCFESRVDEGEMAHAIWESPTKLIEMCCNEEPTISLPPPQFYELLRLRIAPHNKMEHMADPARILPQLIRAEENPNLFVGVMPEDHLHVEEPAPLRILPSKLILSPTDEEEASNPKDRFPIHRTTHLVDKKRGLDFTKYELHLRNLEQIERKVHLFYWENGENTSPMERNGRPMFYSPEHHPTIPL